VLGDRAGHKEDLAVNGKSLLVHALEEFHLVHESSEGVSPSFSDSLQELNLHLVDLEFGVMFSSFLLGRGGINESSNNGALDGVVLDDSFSDHISLEDSAAFINFEGSSVNVKTTFGLLVRAVNSSEVGNLSITGLLPESLRVTLFTNFALSTAENFFKFTLAVFVGQSGL